MFRALLCPSSEACDYAVDYDNGHIVLGLLYVEGKVQLGWSSVRVAGSFVFYSSAKTVFIPCCVPPLQFQFNECLYYLVLQETVILRRCDSIWVQQTGC